MKVAERISKIPPYLFAQIEKKIEDAKEKGVEVISLGIGDPDIPTPDIVIDTLCDEAKKPDNHRYPSSKGTKEFRSAVVDWYKRRFGVDLDIDTQVCSLIGSKEGIAHVSMCFVDPGDINLIPDPSYPVYASGTLFAGGSSYDIPLLEENGFLPDLSSIPSDIAKKAKIFFLNYPNNPTGAIATKEFFADVVAFAEDNDVLVCHDAAYTDIAFDGYEPISFLETPGAMDVGIEFGSVSKSLNMTGWRIGWVVGADWAIEALTRLKTNIDSGAFQAVQQAAVTGLEKMDVLAKDYCDVYAKRRDLVVDTLNSLGWNIVPPKATIYVWAPVPNGFTSISFAEYVFDKTGVVITPGNGYGKAGEGYFRISLTIEDTKLDAAMTKLKGLESFRL